MIRLLVFLVFLISLPKVASAECTELSDSTLCEYDKSHRYKVFCKLDSGDIYRGTINCKSKWSGYGEYIWKNGDKYTGFFRNGNEHGSGISEFSNGHKYIGDFVNGSRQGFGMELLNGPIYRGEWLNDKRNGKGTYSFDNGDTVKGIWKNNNLHGKATYTYNNGRVDEVLYENGKSIEQKTIKTGKSQAELDREKRLAEIQRQAEIAAEEQYDRIYNNCIIDKLPADANRTLEAAIKSSCSDIADDPSFFEKMKYD